MQKQSTKIQASKDQASANTSSTLKEAGAIPLSLPAVHPYGLTVTPPKDKPIQLTGNSTRGRANQIRFSKPQPQKHLTTHGQGKDKRAGGGISPNSPLVSTTDEVNEIIKTGNQSKIQATSNQLRSLLANRASRDKKQSQTIGKIDQGHIARTQIEAGELRKLQEASTNLKLKTVGVNLSTAVIGKTKSEIEKERLSASAAASSGPAHSPKNSHRSTNAPPSTTSSSNGQLSKTATQLPQSGLAAAAKPQTQSNSTQQSQSIKSNTSWLDALKRKS